MNLLKKVEFDYLVNSYKYNFKYIKVSYVSFRGIFAIL